MKFWGSKENRTRDAREIIDSRTASVSAKEMGERERRRTTFSSRPPEANLAATDKSTFLLQKQGGNEALRKTKRGE